MYRFCATFFLDAGYMCGIFGIVLHANENIYDLILNGLRQLQNRGYDSTGISVINEGKINVYKYASTPSIEAIDRLAELQLDSRTNTHTHTHIGIGHNRWATHGIKNDTNAHPHLSNDGQFSVVHNGIIENYVELKHILQENGYTFYSQTDSEVVINLIEFHFKKTQNTFEAIKKTIHMLRGTYGLVIQSLHNPMELYCVRNGSPLLVGQNDNCVIVTSEQSGFCNMMNNYITLHNDDICVITKQDDTITFTTSQLYTTKAVILLETELSPQPYPHWTLKEIHEQPNVILNSINKGGRIKNNTEVKLGGLEQHIDILQGIQNIILLGCGTSYFAGLYGMHFFKSICAFNTVQLFDGAEFNDHDIPKMGLTAFILISQSGETKDLHRCIEIAKCKNIPTIGIINVVDSLIAREVDCGVYCNAGKEVGVASTKAFTSQVVCLSMVAIWFSTLHRVCDHVRSKMICDLHSLSNDIKMVLQDCNERIREMAKRMCIMCSTNMFLLGKGTDECIAKEGALKIKEISYIHAEGYSSSSLKHGPFALLDETFPVIICNLDQTHSAKTLNCYQEVKSRNAPIIFVTNDKNVLQSEMSEHAILVPYNKTYGSLLGIIPIQLLAYYLSIQKGINPDKPKNLAKVVTVE